MGLIKLFLLCLTIVLTFSQALAIECYQCSSYQDADCSEIFDHEHTKLKPKPCDDLYEAQYCIKTTGIYEGQLGTQRFCSSRKFEDYCQYVKRKGDGKPQRSCIYSCSSDGCNRGSKLIEINFSLIISCLSITYLIRLAGSR